MGAAWKIQSYQGLIQFPSPAQRGNRNALGRAKNRGNIATPVEDYFDYVGEFWTNAIVDPTQPGGGVISLIEGWGQGASAAFDKMIPIWEPFSGNYDPNDPIMQLSGQYGFIAGRALELAAGGAYTNWFMMKTGLNAPSLYSMSYFDQFVGAAFAPAAMSPLWNGYNIGTAYDSAKGYFDFVNYFDDPGD